MLCTSCSKLALLSVNKHCIKCQNVITNNLSILCDFCSSTEKQCAICLKKMQTASSRYRGCNCSGK